MFDGMIGRLDELAFCGRQVRDVQVRGLLLRGEAGVGKSEFARSLMREVGAELPVRWISAASGMKDFPFAALADLLPSGFSPQAAAAGLDTMVALRDAIRGAATPAGPLALFIDDVQNIDARSASVIYQASRQSELRLVGTLRDTYEPPPELLDMWTDQRFQMLTLEPLGEDDVRTLVAREAEGAVDESRVAALYRRTRGNPLYLREVLAAERRPGGASEGGPSPRLREVILGRIRGLPEASQEILELVALAEPLELRLLESAASPTTNLANALRDLEQKRLLRASRDRSARLEYMLDHPMQGEVLRATTPEHVKQFAQRRIARALRQQGLDSPVSLLRYASLRLECGEPAEEELSVRAARVASASFDPGLAVRLLQPLATADATAAVVLTLADAQHRAGDFVGADATLERVAARVDLTPDQVGERLSLNLYNVFWGLGEADRAFKMAHSVELDPAMPPPLKGVAQMLRLLMLNFSGESRQVLKELEGFDIGSEENRMLAAPYLFALLNNGRARTVIEATRSFRANPDPHEHPVSVWWAAGLAAQAGHHIGWPDNDLGREVLAACRGIYSNGERYGDPASLGAGASMLGSAALAHGRIQDSVGYFRQAVAGTRHQDWIGVGAFSEGGLALALLCTGQVEAAGDALRQAAPVRPGQRWFSSLLEVARAWWLHHEGRLDAAERLLRTTAADVAQRGQVYFAIHVLHELVRLGYETPVAEEIGQFAATVETERPRMLAEHARAWESRDGDGLFAVAEKFREMGYMLFAAEAAGQAAYLARSSGRKSAEARAARLSRECLEMCQGASTPATRLVAGSPLDELTPSERRVALLAARGRTSPEIAGELVLSARTVDSHLGHVYAKLGLSGRHELQSVLGDLS